MTVTARESALRATPLLRVAVGQAVADPDEVVVVRSAVDLVVAAGRAGARVLLLSELFLFGYDVDRYTAPDAAVRLDDPRLRPLRDACVRAGVDLFIGAATDEAGQRWNSLLRLALDGSVTIVHRKIHIWASERAVFAEGDGAALIDVDGFRIGFGICYDAGFPEYTRALVRAGAEIVLFASAFADGDEARRYDLYHPSRALESGVWVAVSNALGTTEGATFFGRGAVFDPSGRPAGALDDRPGLVTVDIDRDLIAAARRRLPYLDDLRAAYAVARPHGSRP